MNSLRTRRPIFAISCLFGLLISTGEVRAQTDEDSGLWLMIFGQGNLEGISDGLRDFRWWFDFQPRYMDAADGLDHLLVRPGLGYAFADNAAAWLGYAWIGTTSTDSRSRFEEDRLWQQLTWSPDIESFNFQSRTRLEQRWLDTGDDVGWRFRQFFKATYPLPGEPRLFPSIYDEVFFDLNDTDWGQDIGFTQNRFFAGLGWNFDGEGGVNLEVGYLNQFLNRDSGTDQMNHILSINLLLSF